jgi:hypothetical protein
VSSYLPVRLRYYAALFPHKIVLRVSHSPMRYDQEPVDRVRIIEISEAAFYAVSLTEGYLAKLAVLVEHGVELIKPKENLQ